MMTFKQQQILITRDGRQLNCRRLKVTDKEALQTFDRQLSKRSRHLFLPHKYDDATVTAALSRSEDGRDLVLGLFDDERIVGYFFLWYFDEPVPLLGIGLLDSYQGQGLGKQIMELLVAAAVANDNDGIELTTMQENDHAFELYKKTGFRYLNDVENVVGDGRIVVERAMFYEIKPGAKPMGKAHQPPV